jgi:hypothetical protein
MVKLNFRSWLESVFGAGDVNGPTPASVAPELIAKNIGGAYPTYDLRPLPHEKHMKRNTMKKQKKH